jgi:hypothetical protein
MQIQSGRTVPLRSPELSLRSKGGFYLRSGNYCKFALLQMMVPDNMVGLLIGRGGENITRQVFIFLLKLSFFGL